MQECKTPIDKIIAGAAGNKIKAAVPLDLSPGIVPLDFPVLPF